jgi:hypothetical protein
MVYAIQASLFFPTAQRRDNVLTLIEAQIAGRNRWGVTQLAVSDTVAAPNGLSLEARFATRTEADATWADLIGLTGQRAPEPGSTATRHDCPHDQVAGQPCVILETFVW